MQSSAAVMRSNVTQYCIDHLSNWGRICTEFWPTKDGSYLTRTGELWGGFYDDLGKNDNVLTTPHCMSFSQSVKIEFTDNEKTCSEIFLSHRPFALLAHPCEWNTLKSVDRLSCLVINKWDTCGKYGDGVWIESEFGNLAQITILTLKGMHKGTLSFLGGCLIYELFTRKCEVQGQYCFKYE